MPRRARAVREIPSTCRARSGLLSRIGWSLLAIVYLAIILGEGLHWGGQAGLKWWADSGWTLAGALATAACLRTALRTRGADRRTWLFFAAGSGLWLAGQLAWNYYDLVTSFPASPTLADIGLLAFAPIFVAGLLSIGSGSKRSWILLTLDLALSACAFAVLFSTLFWSDLQHSPLDLPGRLTTMLYPILYSSLAFSMLVLPLRGAWRNASVRLLLLGLLGQVIPFILWAPLLLRGSYSEGTPLDIVWMAGMLLIAASALSFRTFPTVSYEAQVFGVVAIVPLALSFSSRIVALLVFWGTELPGAEGQLQRTLILAVGILSVLRFAITFRRGRQLYGLAEHARDEARAMAASVQESEQRFRAVFEGAPVGIALDDKDGRPFASNPAYRKMLGYSEEELRRMHFTEYSHPDDVSGDLDLYAELVAGTRDSYQLDKRYVRKDGRTVWARVTVNVARGSNAEPRFGVVVIEDISDRKPAEEARAKLAAIVESSEDAIIGATPQGVITSWNRGAERLHGYAPSEAIDRHLSMLVPPDRRDELLSLLARLRQGESISSFETVHRRNDGQPVDVSLSLSPVRDGDGRVSEIAVICHDVSERKRFEEQLKHQALHDALTGLPNRLLLHDRLEQAILAARRGAASMALFLMDLDRFKDINDTLGHQAGDALLREVACRLENTLRGSDTVARLGGDEFAVILPAVDEAGAGQMAGRIQQALREPLVLEGQRIDIAASIGIALYPRHGEDAGTLLRRADVAMYAAKRSGKDHCTYRQEHDPTSPARLALVGDLRYAIDHGQLLLHYQPIVNMHTGRVEHVEALVRWQHLEHGFVLPGEFITLAEETGLIEPLTLWVLRAALQQHAAWRRAGVDLRVAVNLSARNLQESHLPDTIAWLLRSAAVEPAALIVEITETALMADPEQALELLTQLHRIGVRIAIDDFGTGYSSLAYLKQLPVDEIKIDRSFVMGMTREGAEIVRAVIDLGRNLKLKVTAEGVENREAWDALARMGCNLAQGYYLSRPLPADEVPARVATLHEIVNQPAGNVILVVDDNPVYQELLQVLLTGEGYEVVTAADAEEALGALQTTTPDLILTDVQLPGMSGLELVRRIRSDTALRDTVIVAMTGAPQSSDEQRALRAGCDVYAAKPKCNADVIRLVRRYLAA